MSTSSKTVDYLKVDPPLIVECRKPRMEQKWAVVSFASPEDRIKQRFMYEASRFLYHDVNKQIMDIANHITKMINTEFNNKMEKKIASYKSSADKNYKAAADILVHVRKEDKLDEDDMVNKVLRQYRLDPKELSDRFDTYKVTNEKELESSFTKEVTEQTSVRGLKIRGVFEELEDARARAKDAQQNLEPAFNSFAVPVGYWCPWDPNADAVQDQEYMLPGLNDLVGGYNRNMQQRNEFFEKDKQRQVDAAGRGKEENIRAQLKQRLTEKADQRLSQEVRAARGLPTKVGKKKKTTTGEVDEDDIVRELDSQTSTEAKLKRKEKKLKRKENKKAEKKALTQTADMTLSSDVETKSMIFEVAK
jgi:hypothetical protein